ncbi:DNA-binding protein [Lysinibacillus fusiformis]|uniref:DNA-binding protein n=1 Tax=Lysinibacillus fusiformis TaxID=28031 RepID=UPI001F4E6184|nr:DNA-binding protein [Lysinibacillus fusiformis]MCK1989362.1 DNA-binding protein [Lysinibacillus fusiformis]
MQQTFEVSEGLESILTELIINYTNQAIKSQHFVSKDWFSLSEATVYVGVSYNTFMKFRLMGLKISEINGVKRVSKKEIDRFLEQHSF